MVLTNLAAGPSLDLVDLSRWQFGITTVYHFIFVPLTIGLAPLVAFMQTMWAITRKPQWFRATKFFGAVFMINFAMGVATGIVQEFQFGMNWSEYSRMIGDVFGGPLALEGLVAFFMESVFLGLWFFGWGRIPIWLHTASIWLVALAVNLSAYFIIVANSFMQHPMGAEFNPATGRAELTDIVALLTNPTALAAFPHAVAGPSSPPARLCWGFPVGGSSGTPASAPARQRRRPPTSSPNLRTPTRTTCTAPPCGSVSGPPSCPPLGCSSPEISRRS